MALAETARLIASLELKDLFSKQIGNAEKSLGSFDRRLDQTQSRAYRAGQQIGHGIQNTAKVIATAAVAVGTITAGVVAKGIAAASDLSETVSKIGVVFGNQKDAVLAFGKTSAAALGLSENAALSAAGTYGNLFVSMGLLPKASASMSTALVKLAADLASFNNVAPEDALDALRSGLTGETEPLKRFGINLNEATLKAKALELGLIKTSGSTADLKAKTLAVAKAQAAAKDAIDKYGKGSLEAKIALNKVQLAQEKVNDVGKKVPGVLDPATKAQAAYALIMEQSKTAQGDFARTSGGLANQVRILKANFTDMLATIGGPVLPQVAKIFQRINALVKENQPQVAKFGQAIADLFTDANLNKGVEIIKGAVGTFKAAAPFIEASAKATLGFVQAAVGVFKSLPAPLQGLIAGGFALNKLTGGLVTNIAGGLADLIGKSRGASPANPVFVADVSGGLGGALAGGSKLAGLGTLLTKLGGLGLVVGGGALLGAGVQAGGPAGAGIGALGGAGAIAGGALLAGPAGAIVAAIAATGKTLLDIRDQSKQQGEGIASSIANQISGGAKLGDLRTSLAAVETGINQIQANPLNVLVAGDALDQLKAQRELLLKQISLQTRGQTPVVNAITGFTTATKTLTSSFAGKEKDDRAIVKATLALIANEFKNIAGALKTGPASAIKNAIKEALDLIGKGRGDAGNTKNVLEGLKAALKRTHDPELQRELKSAIAKVEHVLPGRQFAAKQLAKADSILRSNEKSARKIDDLKAIERALKDRGLPHAASQITQKIDQAKREQVYAQHAATQAIKDKDLSVTVKVPPAQISVRSFTDQIKVIASYGHTAIARNQATPS